MNWLSAAAQRRRDSGLHRSLRERQTDRIDIASNDYLGLARDPGIIEAGVEAMRAWGAGSTGSRLVSGHTPLHAELEATLARLLKAEDVLTFSSGYLANLAAVTALCDHETLLLSDAYNHASIVDACRLSRGQVQIYPNGDVNAVERALSSNPHRRAVVVTDAVFSVDGNLAPLPELSAVCQAHDALLIVDEAHSVGVLNAGAGACADLLSPTLIRTFTLSKALGSQGGGVAASADIVEHLVNTARSFIFDTGLAPAPVGSALAAARRVLADPALPQAALTSTRTLATTATTLGFDVASFDAAVAAIRIGAPEDAVRAQAICAEAGVDVGCFRPPSVPDGVARLRMTGHADLRDHTPIEKALTLVKEQL
jgi:8-amino-7-oxononanoate synthase